MSAEPVMLEQEAAACCARFYEQDWVRLVLGDSFHPGGIDLSRRLVKSLYLPPGARVLDVACGIGTTSRLMAHEFALDVVGLDFSESNITRARQIEQSPSAEFVHGAAELLPFPDESFDALVCECAVSTFVDQPRVLNEFARVLKSGGVVGISDMILEGTLPEDLAGRIAPWTCLASARSTVGYQSRFLAAGFRVIQYADESVTLKDLVLDLKRKLVMAGLAGSLGAIPGLAGLDMKGMRDLLQRASDFVADGTVQYGRMNFSKGRPRFNALNRDADCVPSPDCCNNGD